MKHQIDDLESLGQYAAELVRRYPSGRVIGLSGGLGSGKTALVRKVIEFLAVRSGLSAPKVISPTFVIHQTYPRLTPSVDHLDLYRLEKIDSGALIDLGYYEILERQERTGGFVFIEWPEHVRDLSLLGLNTTITVTIEESGSRTYLLSEF